MGGEQQQPSYTVVQPSSPAPTATQSMADYVANLPQMYEVEKTYRPQLAAVDKQIQEQLYPTTEGLKETIAGVAAQGLANQGLPDWAKQQYASDINAQLGNNVSSPIGAEYKSRGMLEMQKSWQDYYNQLGLAVAGKLQYVTPTPVGINNYTPQNVMNYNSSNYGAYTSGTRVIPNQQQSNPWMNLGGTLGGALLGGWAGRR